MKCCSCRGSKILYTILFFCGVVLIVLPLSLHNFIDEEIRKEIAANVKIEPGSQVYDQWKKPTVPVYLQIYAFTIANPDEVKDGKPPFVFEKGPYSYRESREKVNISWGDANVNYNQVTNYTFDPETSCDDCDPQNDKITSVNVPFVAITQLLNSLLTPLHVPYLIKYNILILVSVILESINEHFFMTRTVNETVWGYNESLFDRYDELLEIIKKKFPKVWEKIRKDVPAEFPKVFALQANPNMDGNSTVNTGQSNIDKVGCYQRWKDNFGKLKYWRSSTANMLNGTDGSIYKPDISKDDSLYIFITQLCRSLNVKYLDEVTIEGIDGYRFNPPKYLFESGDVNPNNKGFCNPKCLPSGLLSVNACVPFNAPIVVSQPHFLNGNKTLFKKVLGLTPNEEKHDTFLSLEPKTGILLEASKRIQFNIHVEPIAGIADLEGVKEAQFPIMWINERVKIDTDNANKIKKNVLLKIEIIKWGELGLIILGSLMVLIAMVLLIRLCYKNKDSTRLKLMAETDGQDRDYGSVTNGHLGYLNPSLINASD